MSQNPDEGAEKSHEPTQKKLDDARKKGEVPKSVDLITASAYAGFILVMLTVGAATLMEIGANMANLVGQSDQLSTLWFQSSATPLALGLLLNLGGPLAVWFGVPAGCALLCIIAQRAFVIAPERISPKLNRISLVGNAKNKFGRSGLFEFFKSSLKLILYSTILLIYIWRQVPKIVSTAQLNHNGALYVLSEMILEFFSIVLAIAVSLGFFDLLFQRTEHTRKNMMTRKELMDETKQSEGDPHIRQQRRQRAQEIAMNSMLAEVPDADVVVVNPEHYAVALKWSREPGSAPICVAKGVDEVASRIRERAVEAGVPIHRDAPTARALYATIDLKEQIRPEHFKAVAAAIRFAESMRAKARRRFW